MSNDKDFKLKNAVEVGGPTKVTLGTVTSNNIDLATGNYFADTPSGTSTYTISNAGAVQSFQLEVTGGTAEVASVFGTYIESVGAGATTVDQGIDLAGEGGLWWGKIRNLAGDPDGRFELHDTERGAGNYIRSDSGSPQVNSSFNFLSSFTSTGYTGWAGVNGYDVVSWTFRKAPSFFDIVTYTGDGSSDRQISHNLGSVPAVIICKNLDDTENWAVYHKDVGNDKRLILNQTLAAGSTSTHWNNTTPTSTEFTVGSHNSTNGSGDDIVAYLFAHDDAADGLIQCGSYTGGGETDVQVNLGWQPQWLLIRRSDSAEDWFILDTQRGLAEDGDPNALLLANTSGAETSSSTRVAVNSTGFFTTANTGAFNASGGTYIYIAIRAASDLDLTWPSSIEWAGGIAPSAPATGETDVFTLSTDDGGTSYVGVKTADNLS